MKQSSIIQQLLSDDPNAVLDGLFALGALRDEVPQPEIFRLAVRHLASEDPDVRRQAVLAAVVHWGHVPAFQPLAAMVLTEQDQDVLVAVLSGLSRLGQEAPSLVGETLAVLRHFCFSQGRLPSLGRRAFLEAKAVVGDVPIGEYASFPADDGPDEPSEDWFDQAARRLTGIGRNHL